jgi:hypothetical protein
VKRSRADERDTSWEVDSPTVRAYFWLSPTSLDCIDIDDASVEAATAWAEEEARRRDAHLELAVLVADASGARGLIWIRDGGYGARRSSITAR